MQLSGCGARRDREVEARNHTCREKLRETPERCLGLARSGLGFKNHESGIRVDAAYRRLCRIRFGKVGQLQEARGRRGGESAGVETDRGQRPCRSGVCPSVVVGRERCLELEEPRVRTDPVRQSGQSRDLMAETRRTGQVLTPGFESCGEPSLQGIVHPACFGPPVVLRQRWPFPKSRRRWWLDRASVVGKHRSHEQGHGLAPVPNPPDRLVERVLGPLHGQHQERPAFLEMPGGRMWPESIRPALCLKSWMQLSDVVKERQGGESPTRRLGQCGIRRRLQAIANDRQLQHSREHCRHVHGVMSEGMKLAAVLVGLAPGLEHRSQVLCGVSVVLIQSWRTSTSEPSRPIGIRASRFSIRYGRLRPRPASARRLEMIAVKSVQSAVSGLRAARQSLLSKSGPIEAAERYLTGRDRGTFSTTPSSSRRIRQLRT